MPETTPLAPSELLAAYRAAAAERASLGVPPLPLSAPQAQALTELLQAPPAGEEAFLLELLSERIPPGVDEAAYVKASWLSAVAQGITSSPLVSPVEAVRLLATMIGGYNVGALIELLGNTDAAVAEAAATGLSRTVLVYDAFHDVLELAATNTYAQRVVDSWAAGEWFTAKPELAAEITLQPIKAMPMDAAILFNDILTPLPVMGLDLDFVGGVGPQISNRIETPFDVDRLGVPAIGECGAEGHRFDIDAGIADADAGSQCAQGIDHQLGVARKQGARDAAGAIADCSQYQRAIRHAL